MAELETLTRFVEVATREGVRLPEDSQSLRHDLERWSTYLLAASAGEPAVWPPDQLLSLMALAQHYGVATRALDWTWSSLTAAYFATQDAPTSGDGSVAVWIFTYLATVLDRAMRTLDPGERPLRLFTAPGADNENLRAQRGLFMCQVQTVTDAAEAFTPRPYEDLFSQSFRGTKSVPIVLRVLAPYTEVPVIRWRLGAAGVTAGRLFPGLSGVARELHEEKTLAAHVEGFPFTDFARAVQNDIVAAFKRGGA